MMFGSAKTVIGLDIGTYAVKAVALQPNKGRVTLQGYAHIPIGDIDQADAVRRAVEQLGVKPRQVVTAVSGRSVIVRQITTPRLNDNELKQHIVYEADKYIPFGTDEVVIDCQVMPEDAPVQTIDDDSDEPMASPPINATANPNMDVLLVAVRRNFVEDHVSMLHAAGIHSSAVDVDVFAMVNAFTTLGPKDGAADGVTALVDIGAAKSWIAFVRNKRLLFQREIYLAGNELTDAIVRTFNEDVETVEAIKINPDENLDAILDATMPPLEDLANEIRLSFDYVEGQHDEQVGQVVLSGSTIQLPQLAEALGNLLERPVQIFDPLSGVDLVPSSYDLHGLDANAPGLTVALGLACHELPDSYQGLGGTNLMTWRSRSTAAFHSSLQGSALANTAAATAIQSAPIMDVDSPPPPPPPDLTSSSVTPTVVPLEAPLSAQPDLDLASLAQSMPPPEPPLSPTPAPPAATPLASPSVGAPVLTPPPSAPPPVIDNPMITPPQQPSEPPSASYDKPQTETGIYRNRRSSILVVLDEDDQEDLPGASSPQVSTDSVDHPLSDSDDLPPLPSP
ncbi:MAG: type IV pilus assembly protein PilM [Planctomycetota bacterium]